MKQFISLNLVCLGIICSVFFQMSTPAFAGSTDTLVLSDNFNNSDTGAFNGQNQWLRASQSGANWIIQDGTSGLQLRQNIIGDAYYDTPITQTNQTIQDSRIKVDFQATGADGSPQIWLRRSSIRSDAKGYALLYFGGIFYIDYLNGILSPAALASGGNPNLVTNNWYTAEFEAINDLSGNPVLKAWIYDQGTSRPDTPYLTFTDTNKYVATAGYAGLGSLFTPVNYDNFNLYSGDATFPAGTPTALSGSSGDGQVTLNWTAPTSDGGSTITDYLIQYRTGTDSFQTFNHAASTATSRIVTGLTHGVNYDFRVSAINTVGIGSYSTTTASTTSHNITITSPVREVSGASDVATISINRDECNSTFHVPYIQTATTLSVTTTVSAGLPVGGGVKFVLTKGSTQLTQYDMTSPFTSNFTSLAKGEYTLDTYIVDSDHTVQAGVANHDQATHIGIGDIYVAIGDSITEGYDGTAYNTDPYPNWLNVPIKSTDNRNYPQCGTSSGFYQDHWQEVSQHIALNNTLTSILGYPIFILNEGFAGITTSGYLTRTGLTSWQNRINTLSPNKWLVHLGVNDGGGSSGFQSDMQSLITVLKNSYGAIGSNIILATPTIRTNWQPYISNLISDNNLTTGPDFNIFFSNHSADIPSLYGAIHPTTAGETEMARLWGISLYSPQNLNISQNTGTIILNWNDLTSTDSSIAGYKVKYGTVSGTYSTTIDVGNVTTKSITGLTEGQTYYFVVSAYDNDPYSINQTQNSSEVSITPDMTVPVTTDTTDSSWHSSDITITLTCTDSSGSGCAHTYYTTDGSTPTTSSSEGTTIIFSSSGNYTLKYFSIDNSNNSESVKTAANTIKLDKTEPIISTVATGGITASTVTITWATDEDASSKVDYGLSNSYGSTTPETDTSPLVSSHSVNLSGLSSCTQYNYRVRSKDFLFNEGVSGDTTFTTTGCPTPTSTPTPTTIPTPITTSTPTPTPTTIPTPITTSTPTPTITPTIPNNNPIIESNNSNNSTPICNNEVPPAPKLFQANVQGNSAKIFFTPLTNTNRFFISFSPKSSAEEHGAEVTLAKEGVQNYTVNALKPNTIYYFKVRGQNGCMPGGWSNTLQITTKSNKSSKIISFYPTNTLVIPSTKTSKLQAPSTKSRVSVPTVIPTIRTITPTITVKQETAKQQSTKKQTCILWWCFSI